MDESSADLRQGSQQDTNAESPQSKRRKVEHLFWVADLEFVQEYDLPTKALCGFWTQTAERETEEVERVDFKRLPDPEDCTRCLRVLAASWRRARERSQR